MIRAALLACCLALPAMADPVARATDAADQLRAAGEALAAAERSSDRLAALTETVRAYEGGLAVLRDALRDAALRERAIRDRFNRDAEGLSRLLAALQTMSRSPEAAVLLHPSGGLGTARASMLMAETVPAMTAEAARLRADLEELEVLVLLRQDALDMMEQGLAAAQSARTALGDASAARGTGSASATDDAILFALVNGAETLDGFASSVTASETEGADAFAEARGQLALPVAGVLLAGFGDVDAAGVARPGLLLATEPQALVTTPWPGTVRYAGPLLDYGNVILIEPQAGYLVVLAGLGELYVGTGTLVRSGDPLGLTSGQAEAAQGNLIAASEGGGRSRRETLYIEVRTTGGPQDPAPWFGLGNE
jgi:murein hydrolase activator